MREKNLTEPTHEELRQAAYRLSDEVIQWVLDEKISPMIAHMAILDSLYSLSYMSKIKPDQLETILLDMITQYREEDRRQTQGFQKLED